MVSEFQQKQGIGIRKFILKSDRILLETKTLRKNSRYEVKLDELGLDIYYQSDNTTVGKLLVGVFIVVSLGSIIAYFLTSEKDSGVNLINAIIFGLLAFFAYFKPHQDDIALIGGKTNLLFYRQIPDEKTVLEFIDKVRQQTKSFMKEKYTAFDATTDEQDFYNRINWLRDKEIISPTEYVECKTSFETHRLL